jgi:hypothetical protein
MKDLMSMLRDPMYAAGIAAVVGLLAKWLDNKISDRKGRFVDYLKMSLYSAALVGGWVWLLRNPAQTREATRQLTAPVRFPSL